MYPFLVSISLIFYYYLINIEFSGGEMKYSLLNTFLPMIAFFISYKVYNIYIATSVIIIITAAQLIYEILLHKKIPIIHTITFTLVLILGLATILFQEEAFIKWKVTIMNWLISSIFIFSRYFVEKPVIQYLIGDNFEMPSKLWKQLNNIWGFFFFLLGSINLFVLYFFSTDSWVYFKLFGILGLTLMFMIGQSIFLSKKVNQNKHL